MINHDQARSLVSARYDELLSPQETRILQEHLAGCASCRQFAAHADILANGLRGLPQLPPSPQVSRVVREGIQTTGASPWGWLGAAMRVVGSPGMAVASSLALVAAFAFIIVLAMQPGGTAPQPLATISALADIIETPTIVPTATPEVIVSAPTAAPTEASSALPTQAVSPTATSAPEPTATAAAAEPTSTPRTLRTVSTREPSVETPVPTEAPALPTSSPIEQSNVAPEVPAPTDVPVEPQPTIAPIDDSGVVNSDVAVQEVTGDSAPVYQDPVPATDPEQTIDIAQPAAVGEVANAPVGDSGVIIPTAEPAADGADGAVGTDNAVADDTAPSVEAAPTTEPMASSTELASEPVPTAVIIAVAPPDTTPPALPERNGNEALSLSGDSLAAEIQAEVEADINTDSGPPPLPESSTLAPPAGQPGEMPPMGIEITGAPAAPLGPDDSTAVNAAPIAVQGTDATTGEQAIAPSTADELAIAPESSGEIAPVTDTTEIVPTDPALAEANEVAIDLAATDLAVEPAAPVALGAPEPGWPYIGGVGTQFLSNAGYSATSDGGAVTVYSPDGIPLGVVGAGGSPIWAPWGTSLLVIGPIGQAAVWDANGGLIPVEPAAAARDVPAGWLGSDPVVQRIYRDGSGLVELRVVPVTGAAGYPLGSATADSLFGEGVSSLRLSPDGGQISFVSGGTLYIAPASDPGNASPAG